ncbi:MAG: protein-export chaperone SecB [Rhodospirillales bacterium]|nr:protein-export chaperone SecB [Rhodospirillales bacterium]MSP80607.1 protein-export chaperone SecB [Rhodospirillales bacterium]
MNPADKPGNGPEAAPPASGGSQPMIVINSQYIKDLSFEAPGGMKTFVAMQKTQPAITVNLDVQVTPFQDPPNVYEVVLTVKAECKIGEAIGFIVELAYAGAFTLTVAKEHLQPVLLIECPRALFPFARNILADVTRDGGFPPLMLGVMDFAGLYQARMTELAKQHGQAPGAAPAKPA